MLFRTIVSLETFQSYEKSELYKKIHFSLQFSKEAQSTELLLYFTKKNKLRGPRQAFYALTQVNVD